MSLHACHLLHLHVTVRESILDLEIFYLMDRLMKLKIFTLKLRSTLALFCIACAATGPILAQPNPNSANEIIVKFDSEFVDGMREADRLSNSLGRNFEFVTDTESGRLVFRINEHQSVKSMIGLSKAVERLSGVSYAEPNRLLERHALPNDPSLTTLQWHYFGPDAGQPGGLNVVNTWSFLDESYTKAVVAVLDTGQTPHPDLDANTRRGYDMISYTTVSNDGDGRDADPSDPGDWTANRSSSWHGTHVAGTIGAVTNNGLGVAGVGDDRVEIMHVRVLGTGGGYTNDIADGIYWAADNGANVINMSLGGGYSCEPNSITQQAINYAVSKNVTVVVSAGNSNADASGFSPAGCANVISVGASNGNASRSYYSNYGTLVDVSAPGGDYTVDSMVYSTLNMGDTVPGEPALAAYQGTSMAAPHIAGLAALLYSEDTSLSPSQIETIIKQSAVNRPVLGCSNCGAGIADALVALRSIDSGSGGGTGPEEPPTLQPPAMPNLLASVFGAVVTLSWNDVADEEFYELEYRTKLKGRNWSEYVVIDSTIAADSFSSEHSPGNGTFQYRLRAINAAGSSAWAESGNITVDTGGSSGGGSGKCNPKKGC